MAGVARCVNIDWLELYCLEELRRFPMDAEFYRRDGWHVEERAYGTRVFQQMFTLYGTDGYAFLEVRRSPYSSKDVATNGLFEDNACHLRLTNRACYLPNCIDLLRQFLVRYNFTLKKIYRLDVCLDFEKFDYGDDPAVFIERYMRGRYAKLNQCNLSAHGTDWWDGRKWNSLSWGSPSSMISTKIYNKTMELAQGRDKPYIRYAWFVNGLVDDFDKLTKRRPDGRVEKVDIWRVEFSIKAGAQRWFVMEDHGHAKVKKIPMKHTLDMYDSPLKLLTVFGSLALHYFHFKKYVNGLRKDRCEDKKLFNFLPTDKFYKVAHPASDLPRNYAWETLRHRLEAYRLHLIEPELRKAVDLLIEHITTNVIRRTQGDPSDNDRTEMLKWIIAVRTRGHMDIPVEELMKAWKKTDEIWKDSSAQEAVQ